MSLSMTRAERESFLAGVHVGVLGVAESDGNALAVPVWYAYEPGGEVRLVTGRSSRKGKLLAAAGRFSLCVQTETAPYRYVSVEGPVTSVEKSVMGRDERPLAHRYLGPEMGEMYLEATGGEEARDESILVKMRPERWYAVDYSKQFGSS